MYQICIYEEIENSYLGNRPMLTGLLLIPTIASIVTIMLLEAKKEQLSLEMGVEKHELLLCQNIKLAIKSMLQGLLLGVALILLEASLTIFIY